MSQPQTTQTAARTHVDIADPHVSVVKLNETSPTKIPTSAAALPSQQYPPAVSSYVPVPMPVAMTVQAPVVKIEETPTEQLQREARRIFSAFVSEAIRLSQSHTQQTAALRVLRQTAKATEARVRESRLQLAQLEGEQQRLALAEEFDRADALSEPLDSLRSDLLSMDSLLRKYVDDEVELNVLIQLHRNELSASLGEAPENILDIKKQQVKLLEKATLDSDKRQAAEDLRLRTEEGRIAMERGNIQREAESLASDTQRTEAAIDSQAGEMMIVRKAAQEQLDVTTAEIEELERQLRAKRAEQMRLQQEVDSVDSKIADVRRKFERQLSRLEDRRGLVSQQEKECEQEEAQIRRERESYVQDVDSTAASRRRLRLWCNSLDSEVAIAEMVKIALLSSRSTTSPSSPSSSGDGDLIAEMKLAVTSADSDFVAAVTAQNELVAKLDQLMAECKDLEERIPKLEVDKKGHAAAKRFKEAAAVAKDVKVLVTRKEELDAEASTTSSAVVERGAAVRTCVAAQEAAAAALIEARKGEDVRRFGSLLVRIVQLRQVKKTILQEAGVHGKDPKGGRSADESADEERISLLFLAPATAILDAELGSLLLEAADIKAEHGFEDSLEEEIEEEEEEVEEEIAEVQQSCEIEKEASADGGAEGVVPSASGSPQGEGEGDAVDPVGESTPAEEADAGPAPEGEERHFLVLEAQELLARIARLDGELDAATTAEDYEQAAAIDEQQASLRADADRILQRLQCTEEEIFSYSG